MSKIDVNQVAEVLKRNQVPPPMLRTILEEINLLTEAATAEGDSTPPVKKQQCILISDPEGRLPKDDFVGWVVQIPDNESPVTTLDRIVASAYDHNVTRKGRLLPVRTIGEALENVPAKILKEHGLWVKTKTPVLMLRTDNVVPNDTEAE